jgi:hypothetical protein
MSSHKTAKDEFRASDLFCFVGTTSAKQSFQQYKGGKQQRTHACADTAPKTAETDDADSPSQDHHTRGESVIASI